MIHAELGNLVPSLHVYVVGKCKKEMQSIMYKIADSSTDRLYIDGNGFIPFDKILSYYINGKWLAGLAIFPYTEHY